MNDPYLNYTNCNNNERHKYYEVGTDDWDSLFNEKLVEKLIKPRMKNLCTFDEDFKAVLD